MKFTLKLSHGISVLVLVFVSTSAALPAEEWPRVSPGVWHVQAKRTASNGKVEQWEQTFSQCYDPTLIFQGYWGTADVGKAGCRFASKKTAPDTYQISSECTLADGGKSTGLLTAIIVGDDRFRLTAEVTENRSHSSASEQGELVSKCPAK
jgi:hypothetical protein